MGWLPIIVLSIVFGPPIYLSLRIGHLQRELRTSQTERSQFYGLWKDEEKRNQTIEVKYRSTISEMESVHHQIDAHAKRVLTLMQGDDAYGRFRSADPTTRPTSRDLHDAERRIVEILALLAGEFQVVDTEDDANWICLRHRTHGHVFSLQRELVFTDETPHVEPNPHAEYGYPMLVHRAISAARAEAFRRGWGDDPLLKA